MDERPPILRWKVMLALLAVVVVAVSLGSALHSTGTPQRTFSSPVRIFYTSGLNSVPAIRDVPGHPGYPAVCGNVKAKLRSTSPALRPYLRRELHRICQRHW
jgi:hypothetical protein